MINPTGTDLLNLRKMRNAGIVPGTVSAIRVKLPEHNYYGGSRPCIQAVECVYDGVLDTQPFVVAQGAGESDPFEDEKSLSGCLWEFILLVGKTNEEIRQFVEKWGLLGQELTETDEGEYREPVWVYRRDAEHLRDLLLLAASLRQRSVKIDDLYGLADYLRARVVTKRELEDNHPFTRGRLFNDLDRYRYEEGGGQPSQDKTIAYTQFILCESINLLLIRASPRAQFTFEREKPELVLDATYAASFLFSRLVMDLIGAITAGVYFCGNCQRLFSKDETDRRIREDADRKTYCSDDCASAAHRAVRSASNKKRRDAAKQST